MLTFDRVIVILRKFFNGRRFFCLATTCTIFQCADKSIIFLPCICNLENISSIPPPLWGEGGLYLAHGLKEAPGELCKQDSKRDRPITKVVITGSNHAVVEMIREHTDTVRCLHRFYVVGTVLPSGRMFVNSYVRHRNVRLYTTKKRLDLEAPFLCARTHVDKATSPINFQPNRQRS